MSITMNLIGGLDIGNGYTKGLIRGEDGVVDEIDVPSGVMKVLGSKPTIPTPDSEAPGLMFSSDAKTDLEVSSAFYNDLDMVFSSDMVPDTYRRLFGRRALTADGHFEQFDVVSRKSKAQQPLSKIIALGCFAAKAVRDYVRTTGGLPPAEETIVVHATAGFALPITEYREHRFTYVNEFKNSTHTVTLNNFESKVTVKITFVEVAVIAEGASAQYAIVRKGEPFMAAMLAEVRRHSPINEKIQAGHLIAATNSIGIDIGEGTVNFPVFTDGKFNNDASMTYPKGFGNVMEEALKAMDANGENSTLKNRKQLGDFLMTKPSVLMQDRYDMARAYVDEQARFFADEVAEQFARVLDVIGARTEVVYVYGGGAGQLKPVLHDVLIAKAVEMLGTSGPPVLYLDASYSRHLNREGLLIAADKAATRVASTQVPASSKKGGSR